MTRFQRWFLYVTTAVATLSGVGYFYMKRFLTPVDPWAVINHPLEPWFLKAHILTAPLMLFAVGLITTQHIWRSLKSSLPTGRKTGLAATVAFGPLVISGYLIQTAATPLTLDVLGWTHLVLGLVSAFAIFEHRRLVRGRKRRRGRDDLPVLTLPTTGGRAEDDVRPAAASSGASRSASGRRARRSGSRRPRTDHPEESSSTASS